MHRSPIVGGITAGLLALGAHAGVITAQAAEPPTVVELCAATSITEVDALLADVADSDLVGALSPLAELTVPKDADHVVVDGDISLGTFRDRLGCVAEDPDPTTTVPVPVPVPVPTPSDNNDGDDNSDNSGSGDVDPTQDDGSTVDPGGQVKDIPVGSVDTGGR